MSSVSGVGSTSPFDVSSPGGKTASVKAQDSTTTPTTSGTSSTGGLTSSAGTEFLDLLIDELKNQDPSNAMDSTQMVGQMISLNQLDQLMSINQELSGPSGSGASGAANTSSADVMNARAALANSTASIPADPASAANANSVLDLSGLNNITTSGVN